MTSDPIDMTDPIDVTALAVAQMRAARAAFDAKADYHRARERRLAAGDNWSDTPSPELAAVAAAHRAAVEASAAASRAYQKACGDALAEALAPPSTVEQPESGCVEPVWAVG